MNLDNTLPLIEYYYIVKDILDKRVENGKVEYLVQWSNTWEPEHRVYCPTLIEKMEKKKREEARMLQQQMMQRGRIANVRLQQISVRNERLLRERQQSCAQSINIPEGAGEPEKFTDIIFRNGLSYFVMLWKGNNNVTLVPVGSANNKYPALVKKYLAATDSD